MLGHLTLGRAILVPVINKERPAETQLRVAATR